MINDDIITRTTNYNTLQKLPKAQLYQLLIVLCWVVTSLFCSLLQSWAWFSEVMILQTTLLLGAFFANSSFEIVSTKKQGALIPIRTNDLHTNVIQRDRNSSKLYH